MFDIEGLPSLSSVYWQNLRPGMVFVGGISINDAVPFELRGFPVMSAALRDSLLKRYQFLRDRSVLVYAPDVAGLSAAGISDTLRRCSSGIDALNGLRAEVRGMRADVLGPEAVEKRALQTELVRQDSLILDHWASGIRCFDAPDQAPSLLGDIKAAVTLADVLTGPASAKLRFPRGRPFELHLAVDASYSMKASGRDGIVRDTLLFFDRWVRRMYPEARLSWHAFSERCAPLSPPFQHVPVSRGETRYAAFARRVLHTRNPDLPCTVLLFTDGMPSDHAEALDHLRRFARQGIDYTQIVFRLAEEGYGVPDPSTEVLDGYRVDETAPLAPLPPEEQEREAERTRLAFSGLAIAAGGNQVILTVDRALGVVAVEAFDRWLGAFSSN
jgi:hypothetical protein